MAWIKDLEGGIAGVLLTVAPVVFPGESHEQLSLPYIVYETQYRREPDLNAGAWLGDISVGVWHTNYDDSIDMANACIAAMERNNGTVGGVNVRHIKATSISPVPYTRSTGVIDFGVVIEFDSMIDA